MRRGTAIHRNDSVKADRLKELKAYGYDWMEINGEIDGIALVYRGVSGKTDPILIDFKGPRTKRTERQERRVLAGWPIQFVTTAEDLRRVLGIKEQP